MIRLLAPAKLNLTLQVLGKRPDGYHSIESLVQKVDFYDRIMLESSSDGKITLRCSDPTLPTDSGNIVQRAAELLRKSAGIPGRGVRIHLDKRIPHGAGLGGGSSDAAAVLLGLDHLWQLSLDRDILLDIAGQLGSDVPLFLHPSPAVIRGRGEIVKPSDLRINAAFVIAYPAVAVSTQWVYSNFRLTKSPGKYRISPLSRVAGKELPPGMWGGFLVNDLETCVFERFPQVKRCKEVLIRHGARASLMSGSGSAVFGLFENMGDAQEAARKIIEVERFDAIVARAIFS